MVGVTFLALRLVWGTPCALLGYWETVLLLQRVDWTQPHWKEHQGSGVQICEPMSLAACVVWVTYVTLTRTPVTCGN